LKVSAFSFESKTVSLCAQYIIQSKEKNSVKFHKNFLTIYVVAGPSL